MRSNGDNGLVRQVVVRDDAGRVVEEKKFTFYADLIGAIHTDGIRSLTTEVIQLPTEANGQFAVVKATLETRDGAYTGLGDASPDSVEPEFAPHLLRVAETRAKARALRDALGIGLPAIEELAGPISMQSASQTFNEAREGGNKSRETSNQMTESQRRYLFRLLQGRGLEGEAAKQYLLNTLKVENLSQVTRNAASQLIDHLLAEDGDQADQGAAHA